MTVSVIVIIVTVWPVVILSDSLCHCVTADTIYAASGIVAAPVGLSGG